MKRLNLLLLIIPFASAFAATETHLGHSGANVNDTASVQRGAAMYMNYCSGCHSAQYMRYNRLAEDLGLGEELVRGNLIFGDREISDYMLASMPSADAEEWFGIAPPDLTLVARTKAGGVDWVYTFLKSFYLTENGWNNTVLENASMPHVLWKLQGIQKPIYETHTDDSGHEYREIVDLELVEEGSMSPEEYDLALRDLSAFLEYMAEPAALERKSIGVWVILFLAFFTFLSYLLYKEFWKDIK